MDCRQTPAVHGMHDPPELWLRWREQGDCAARERLICHYLPLARMIAAMTYGRRPNDDIEFGDYLQLASLGLMDAMDRFDPSRRVLFRTFAAPRIRGAVLDGLERLTEKQQQVAALTRLRRQRLASIHEAATGGTRGGHHATTSTQALFAQLAETGVGLALALLLEDTGLVDVDAFATGAHAVSPEVVYFRQTETLELRKLLRDRISRLPTRERSVVHLHYVEEQHFERIASTLGLSRSRVSQLHAQAITRLRGLIGHPACQDLAA